MALQGTLDTFALPDVLRLLAATKKTGRLQIAGSHGEGSVSVTAGAIAAVEAAHAPHATEPRDALFELLRLQQGSFTFDAEAEVVTSAEVRDVEALLADSDAQLVEWRQIEAIVPSLGAFVRLRRGVDGDAVTIAASQWATVVAVGSGATVRAIGDHLELAEIPVSRAVRELVELGVVDISLEAPEPAPTEVPVAQVNEPPAPLFPTEVPPPPGADAEEAGPDVADVDDEHVAPALSDLPPETELTGPLEESLPEARPIRARPRRDPLTGPAAGEPEYFVPLELPGHSAPAASYDSEEQAEDIDDLAASFPGLAAVASPPEVDDGEEFARQLSSLSPRAADAVRAAADEGEGDEPEAAPEEAAGAEDGAIDRGRLLKFLSSVKN